MRIERSVYSQWIDESTVQVTLTVDEIHELFSRALKSPEKDNEVSNSALQKLAGAIDRQDAPQPATA